jgi:hypothetical protein
VSRRLTLAALAALAAPGLAHGQLPELRLYYINVPTWTDSTDFVVGGLGDLNRLRLMTQPRIGPLHFDIAYEHLLAYSQRVGAEPGAIFAGVVPGGGEWLDLQWTIEESDHVTWRHRFDRMSVAYAPIEPLELTAGRQTISWATTLLLTPADPFVPFDPSDPFREYRAGVDAFRARAYLGPLADLDFVLRPADTPGGTTITALVRGRAVWHGWEVSAWAGALHDELALAVAATGAIGSAALRTELELREEDDELVVRGAVGVDTRVDAFGRDLYLLLEYQHDGFGAAGATELLDVIRTPAFARGELQVLGQDELAAQASYQVHPLWAVTLLGLTSLADGSLLVVPGASYSLSNAATAQGGVFLGFGDDTLDSPLELPSEYGLVPTTAYVSLSLFF